MEPLELWRPKGQLPLHGLRRPGGDHELAESAEDESGAPPLRPPREEGLVAAEDTEPLPARAGAAQEVYGLMQAGEDVAEDVVRWEGAGAACRGHRHVCALILLGLDRCGTSWLCAIEGSVHTCNVGTAPVVELT